jgi:hypothetical protein
MGWGEAKRKDDPAPLVVGRISKKNAANLGWVMDGIEREAVEDFKAKLLGEAQKLERPNKPGEDFTAASVRKVKAQGIRDAIKAAEEQ